MSEKYYTTAEKINDKLAENGLVILPNFLDDAEIENMKNGFWDTFEAVTDGKLDRNDQDTWKELSELNPTRGMLFQNYGIGQAQVLWDLRQNEKIVNVFRSIYKDDDLSVSMDGLAFMLPPEITGRGWYNGPDNTHVDQSLLDNDFNWVQGWVTAEEVKDGDATFSFLPGSHLRHKEFYDFKKEGGFCKNCKNCDECKVFSEYKGTIDWYVLQGRDIEFFGELERVQCPAGSLIIWDSRLFHSGSKPKRERENESTRMISYITYYPKSKMSEKMKKFHSETFERGDTSTHHFAKRFAKTPRTYGKEINVKQLPRPVLNDTGKELLNFQFRDIFVEFENYCEENREYPTSSKNKELSKWFASEKKKAKSGLVYDKRLDDIFEANWFTCTKPKLK